MQRAISCVFSQPLSLASCTIESKDYFLPCHQTIPAKEMDTGRSCLPAPKASNRVGLLSELLPGNW